MDRLLRTAHTYTRTTDIASHSLMMAEDDLVSVVGAHPVGAYSVQLRFSDGHEQTVDFGPFLMASMNPLIRRYLDLDLFMTFRVEDGDLLWGDYELCFPVADLYENRI